MIFNTWEFFAFGVVVYILYWYVCPARYRPQFLIVAGTIFYAASIPAYTLLILALGLVTYLAGTALLRQPPSAVVQRRLILTAGLAASVGVLLFFKYSRFFASFTPQLCTGGCTRFISDIIVPLAVSFFTFEFVHVLVDVYLGKIRSLRPRDFALFTMFFPTMVAGPIKRYQNFVPQISRSGKLEGVVFAAGIYRVAVGLAKKSIIADSMTPLTQPLISPGPLYTQLDYWMGTLAYTAKIYFDFTGYSDIAIGVSLLLGYQILENFDRPYWSPNISQFWRRWHMSLSSWIRDYVFIPLGGSRRPWPITSANLAIVMALAGLWHGAAWHFVAWGLWHGIGLAAHRLWSQFAVPRIAPRLIQLPLARGVSIVLTFGFVALGWVLFVSPSVATAAMVYANLFMHLGGAAVLPPLAQRGGNVPVLSTTKPSGNLLTVSAAESACSAALP